MHREFDGVACNCSSPTYIEGELNPSWATTLPDTANPANAKAWGVGPATRAVVHVQRNRQGSAARAAFVPAQWTCRGGERVLAPDFTGDGMGAYLVAPPAKGWPFSLEADRRIVTSPDSKTAELPGGFTVAVAPAGAPADPFIARALYQRLNPRQPGAPFQPPGMPTRSQLQGGGHHGHHHHGGGFAFVAPSYGGPWWDTSPAVVAVQDDGCPTWCYSDPKKQPCPGKCYPASPPNILGLAGPFDTILNALGLRNPLEAIEPELFAAGRLDQIWGKYDDKINRYTRDVGGLQSSGIRAELLGKLGKLGRMRDDLRPFFPSGGAPGVSSGTKEVDDLGQLVQGVDDFSREWSAAKKKYGLVPPAPDAPWTPVPASLPPPIPNAFASVEDGIPVWAWVVGGLAVAVAVGSAMSGRRSGAA